MEVGMAAGANKIGSELKGLGGIETLESSFDERMLANAPTFSEQPGFTDAR